MTFDTLPKVVREKLKNNKVKLLNIYLSMGDEDFATAIIIVNSFAIYRNKYKKKKINLRSINNILNILKINTPEIEQELFPFIFGEEQC